MALVANTWYNVFISTLTNPPWVVPNASALPPAFIDAIINTTTISVFCLTAGTNAQVAFLGGTAIIPDAAMSPSGAVVMDTTVMDDGETWYSMRTGAAGWLFYGDGSGVVRKLTNSSTLGAFIS